MNQEYQMNQMPNVQGQQMNQMPNTQGPQMNQMPPCQTYAPYPQTMVYGETAEQKQKRAEVFRAMALPTVFYALFYTLCLYNNFRSITMPVFVAATIVYCGYIAAKQKHITMRELKWKPMSIFCMIGMAALAVSTACTGSGVLRTMNNLGIFVLLVCMLLFQYCNTGRWTLAKGFSSIVLALFGAIGCIDEPFRDMACYRKLGQKQKNKAVWYIMLGILIAIPLLMIIIALLYYADAVFAQMLGSMFSFDFGGETILGVIVTFCYALLAAYCGLRCMGKGSVSDEVRDHRRFEPMIANTVLVLVSIVYLVFSLIQILYLFWGKMRLPEGYTYASYAREGFFQLLFVCMINMALVLFFTGCFRENLMKKILLTVICACTYVMLASSALRMCLYIKTYNLTFLRILVLWFLVLIGLLLFGVLVQMYRQQFPLFRYMIVVTTVCVLVFTFMHPDHMIAKYNLENGERNTAVQMDWNYLASLSTDAAPVIAEYEGDWVDEYARHISDKTQNMSLRTYNFSYAKAARLMEDAIGTPASALIE